MTTVKKSITRLLAERKGLEGRIGSAIGVEFIALKKGVNTGAFKEEPINRSGQTVAQVEAYLQGNYDKVVALIERYDLITAKVIESNAKTLVTIGGKEITVAQAIERKRSIIFSQNLLNSLRSQAMNSQNQITALENALQQRIDAAIAQAQGSDKKALGADQRQSISDPITNTSKPGLIDPIQIQKKIEELDSYLRTFTEEIDFALSESNSKTEIEIDDSL